MRAAETLPAVLRVDGGMTANRWFMQRQADVLGIPVRIEPSRGSVRWRDSEHAEWRAFVERQSAPR